MKISKNIKNLVMAAVFMVAGAFGVLATAQNVMAEDKTSTTGDGKITCMNGSIKGSLSECGEYNGTEVKGKDVTKTLKNGINLAIGVIGFIAVVIIIYGGFMYTTSAGDSNKVTKAKNAIMYGIIGLVVAMLAFAIVNFVIGGLFPASTTTTTD